MSKTTSSARIETLYRVIYESFTPEMMHRTPMWLKRRIAAELGWRLVPTLSANAWLEKLFIASPGDPVPISTTMFEGCAGTYGGRSARDFFRPTWLWAIAKRIWAGETRKLPADTKPVQPLRAPGMLPEEAECMDTGMRRRRRLL